MSLRDRVAARVSVNPAATCAVRLLADRLTVTSEPTSAEWIDCSNDITLQASKLSRVMNEDYEIEIAQDSIQRHRRGDCKCPPAYRGTLDGATR